MKEIANPLLKRLFVVFGPPSRTTDVDLFIEEYAKRLAAYGPSVLQKAGDRLLVSRETWPTVKDCVDACVEAQEFMASEAAAREGHRPKTKWPWEQNHERAIQWASEFMIASPLADEARQEGWADKLRGYARSHARMTLNANMDLCPPAKWVPPKDVVSDYKRGRV